ncbi:TIGR04222 domain-containing membrane protein [Streptomyces longisporoflavus]|uniref:TIGR04222 domain-containing membrane protein n=1 Tax=Streptomyces longisporoflavus TaxID=28044 RepID=A0ABW7QNZ1_9ACTN
MRMYFRRATTAVGARRALDVYDVAYLAGGPQRVVECAVIALAEGGLLRLRASRVRAVDGEPPAHPVERALVAACRGNRGTASVCAELRESDEVAEIADRLAEWGLVTRARHQLTRVGKQRLLAAEEDENLPAYVCGGPEVLPKGTVRRGVMEARLLPSGLGRKLLRMGNALENALDSSDHYDSGGSGCGGGGGGGGGGGD